MDVIDLTQCGKETNNHCCGGRKTTNREAALDHTGKTDVQRILLPQHLRRATQMVCPIPLFVLRHRVHMELCPLREVQRLQLDDTVLLRAIRHVDSLVDGQSVDLSELMIDVSTQRADAIGAERHRFG